MRISELSERTGFSLDTIRFYGKMGLLPVKQIGRGFKQYEEWHIVRLLQIKYAKAMGFSLQEIRHWLDDWENGQLSREEKIAILQRQLEKLNQTLDEVTQVKKYITQKLLFIQDEKNTGIGL